VSEGAGEWLALMGSLDAKMGRRHLSERMACKTCRKLNRQRQEWMESGASRPRQGVPGMGLQAWGREAPSEERTGCLLHRKMDVRIDPETGKGRVAWQGQRHGTC